MKMGEEVVLYVDGLIFASEVSQCRICHEEEDENSTRLEAPCACSGTVKFAHRSCIQRWCNEKGNTICEICLQKFEPGYTAPPPPPPKNTQLADEALTIRGSLEVPRHQQEELNNPGLMAIVTVEGEIIETDFSECSNAAERSASCCRSVALTFTILLLVRHFLTMLNGGTDQYQYAFTFLTLFLLRASGIVIPLYLMIRTVGAIQNSLRSQYDHESDDASSPFQGDEEDEDSEEEQLHHTVHIHA